jgi:hypothetical protein
MRQVITPSFLAVVEKPHETWHLVPLALPPSCTHCTYLKSLWCVLSFVLDRQSSFYSSSNDVSLYICISMEWTHRVTGCWRRPFCLVPSSNYEVIWRANPELPATDSNIKSMCREVFHWLWGQWTPLSSLNLESYAQIKQSFGLVVRAELPHEHVVLNAASVEPNFLTCTYKNSTLSQPEEHTPPLLSYYCYPASPRM